MGVLGFKAFNTNLINRYGEKMILHHIYSCNDPIIYGKSGFHMCLNLEDTLKYFDKEKGIEIARVYGFGDYVVHDDDYFGYYDSYAFENIILLDIMSREEIIKHILKRDELSQLRFIRDYVLNDDELKLFNISEGSKKIFRY